uniref:Kinesin motor domain-containing protein n=1 Tax=Strigamia maritima TaxID=126957 RepID=T1IPU5_STRMM
MDCRRLRQEVNSLWQHKLDRLPRGRIKLLRSDVSLLKQRRRLDISTTSPATSESARRECINKATRVLLSKPHGPVLRVRSNNISINKRGVNNKNREQQRASSKHGRNSVMVKNDKYMGVPSYLRPVVKLKMLKRMPRYSNGWTWEGESARQLVQFNNDDPPLMRTCYPAMRHIEGDVIRVRDSVLLKSGPRKNDLPFVAKIAALWENPEDGEMMLSLLWYYRPEHTEFGRKPYHMEDEIFASKHKDINSVACIEDKCYVLTFNEYCRYRRRVRFLEDNLRLNSSVVPDPEEGYLRKDRQPLGYVSPEMVFFVVKTRITSRKANREGFDMANVKVAVRVRPMSRRELELGAETIVNFNGDTASITNLKVPEKSEIDSRERIRHFVFDFCYWSMMPNDPHNVTQDMIFNELGAQVLESALDGYNACILAYGQSGSGKTYTMMGMSGELGLIPRICESLFTNASERSGKKVTFHADVSFLEIYNERVCDLLQNPFPHKNRTSLKVREHPKRGPYVQDLSKHDVPDFQTVLSLIERGNQNRSVASTESHSRSSRSHAIFTINFTQACLDAEMPSEIVSKIHLVDLAGSERASIKFNRTRLKEGSNINKSLVTLGNVISALAEKSLSMWSLDSLGSTYSLESMGSSPASSPRRIRQTFVPYRDSVLTWLLKDSFGGNSKTIMIATISPASTCYSETIGTLHYAQRAKCIVNKPIINEDSTVKLIRDLRAEIARLRELLANAQIHNVINSSRDEVSIVEILNENERNAFTLTKTWMEKWHESGRLVEDSEMSILKSKSSVIVDTRLPHLIVLDNHILSTGIKIYYLKYGKTRIGNDSSGCADIGVSGSTLLPEHCELDFDGSNVTLSPLPGATCFINEYIVHVPTLLRQADIVKLGSDLTLRFNHPSEVQKLINEKNKEKLMLKPPSHFIYDNEQNSGFINWCCHECLLNRCNGATTATNCPLHVYSFPICQQRQFCERFLASTSCADDKLKVAIHHVDSSNTTSSCCFAKDIFCTDKHKTCCYGNGIGRDSAITDNCKNSDVLPGDRIQVTPLILHHLENEKFRNMSGDMLFIGDFDGANCSVKLANASENSCHVCCYGHYPIDKYCAFSVGANTQIMTWASPKNSTVDSKLFMDNLVCRSHLASSKWCENEAVAENSIVITDRCNPIGDTTSEVENSALQSRLSDEVCLVKNKQVNCVKDISNSLIMKEKHHLRNKSSNFSSAACLSKRQSRLFKHKCCWKSRRRSLQNFTAKLKKRSFVHTVRKTNVYGRERVKKRPGRLLFSKSKMWKNDAVLTREYRTKNKVSYFNTKVDLDVKKLGITSSSQCQLTSNSGLLNNAQQFVNFVKEITDSEHLVEVLTNPSEEENVEEKSIAKEIPAIQVKEEEEEEINQSQIMPDDITSITTNSLSVLTNDTELKRTLSNNDIHQSVNLIENNDQSEENVAQQTTKVRTNSWSEPSQMSLEQLDSEIKDLQENLKVDLVNQVLDSILLNEYIPQEIEQLHNNRMEKSLPSKKLVRQSAKLCTSPELRDEIENEGTSQVQKRPLRMIGGVMSRSISLEEEEIDCGQRATRPEHRDEVEGGQRAPPLIIISQPSNGFSESGVVLDDEDFHCEDELKNNDVDDDEGSGRFDDNRSIEFPYSDDFESDESNDDESGNEDDDDDNGIESDEDIFYIPIDQLRGFSPPQIVVDKELVFELEGFTRKGQVLNSTQSCQVRHEGTDQLKSEREEFITSNIQVNANDESLRFAGHYHNKELASRPQNLSKDKTEQHQMDEDSQLLIDFSTPCDLLNDPEDEEDEVFACTGYTLSPMDILIDYRMMSPVDRHRLYTIPELSSEYSSTPTEGILGNMSEADVACLEEDENICKNQIVTSQNEAKKWCGDEERSSLKNNDDEIWKNGSCDKLFHNLCDETECDVQCGPTRDWNEQNANHKFQPQVDSSVVNPGIGLDSKRDLGTDTGDDSSSCKKTGHLLIMQSDSVESSNNTLEGETAADVATVQAPAACRDLWKLYKQFSEDSEDEGARNEAQDGMEKVEQPLREKEVCGHENSPCECESEANMPPHKDHNSDMSHDASVNSSDYYIQKENGKMCDKITENVNTFCDNRIIIDNEELKNLNKTVKMDFLKVENGVNSMPDEMTDVCRVDDVFVSIDVNGRLNIDDRCVQRSDESCEGRMNNTENECVLTQEISKDACGKLSNQMSNRCSDQLIGIFNENEKKNGEIETCNFEKNIKEFEEDVSLSEKKKMLHLSEITWMKTNQWVNPVKDCCDILPPIKLLNTRNNSTEANDAYSDDTKSTKTDRERSITPDSLDDVTSNGCTLLKSRRIGQASPTTPTNLFARNKLSPLAGPRSLYTKNTDFGAFSDLWGASTDSITFVFLGPASNFGQEGLFTRNLRSPKSPGRSNSWKLQHESLLPRSISLDCINGMVQYSLTTRATSMESMIPEDLMNVIEKGRLHGIDLEEMRGDQTSIEIHQDSPSPEFCRALKYYSHSKNNSFMLPSRAFSQGSVVETPVSSKKSLAFERKTKKSVSWSDLSGHELAMEEGSISKQRNNMRDIKPIIKKVESNNYIHPDYISNSCDYTETDAEEDLKKCALFTKIQKKRNPSAWVIAPQTQSFALKLPDHVKARIKPAPAPPDVQVKNEIYTAPTLEKSNLNEVCPSAMCKVGPKSFSSVTSLKEAAVTRLTDINYQSETDIQKPPFAQMVEKLLANKEIVEEVQRMDNLSQLNNNMKNANFVVPSSDYDWARLSVILSEASVFFQQLSTFCANRTKLVVPKSDQTALKVSYRDIETQTNDLQKKTDSATTTDNFSPSSTNLPSFFDAINDTTQNYSQSGNNSALETKKDDSKVDSAVQVDTLRTNRSSQGYRFKCKRRREACLKKELEILTQEKGRIIKALERCQQQNGHVNGNSTEDVTTTDDELSAPDNPDYLISYQASLETACSRVVHKLDKLRETKETESHSSTTNSSLLNSPLSYSTEYLPMIQHNNIDTLNRLGCSQKNGLKKHWQQQSHSSSSSLSLSSTKSQSSDYLKPQEYCSQLINIRRGVVAASRNSPLNADPVKKLQNASINEETSPDHALGNTAKDIENLLWECQAARQRAQHEIELAQEQLKNQKMAVKNLASVLQQKV